MADEIGQAQIIEQVVRRYMTPEVIADATRAVFASLQGQIEREVDQRVRAIINVTVPNMVYDEVNRLIGKKIRVTMEQE